MNSYIRSVLIHGAEGLLVEVECQLSNSLPAIIIIGLGNKAVDEAKDRVRGAFASSGLPLPRKRITINLAPADIQKDSTSLDLAIAAAIMSTTLGEEMSHNDTAFIGEVGLSGDVRPVRGIIGKLLAAKQLGIDTFYLPEANVQQALLVPGARVKAVSNLKDLYLDLTNEQALPFSPQPVETPVPTNVSYKSPISLVAGQVQAKRVLEIAAAGGHNVLLIGPPGTGKSMLAKALPSLLPPLSRDEILEITHLYSLAGNKYERLVTERPFRAPHHTSSHISIVGGGSNAKPGELTLSHRGVLLLDEMPEFNRMTLEALRQPLEDKVITIARARQTIEYPADFMLVATANPCPCGFYGSSKDCQCSGAQIQRYRHKFSGPILDRIDLFVSVDTVEHEQLLHARPDRKADKKIRDRVEQARSIQAERLGNDQLNSHMTNDQLTNTARLLPEAELLLNRAAAGLTISARSYMRIVKVARTIADLDGSPEIAERHISEALQYRPPLLT